MAVGGWYYFNVFNSSFWLYTFPCLIIVSIVDRFLISSSGFYLKLLICNFVNFDTSHSFCSSKNWAGIRLLILKWYNYQFLTKITFRRALKSHLFETNLMDHFQQVIDIRFIQFCKINFVFQILPCNFFTIF
jgi:hypothetical protein